MKITIQEESLEVKLLGRGQFSKAYRYNDVVYFFTRNDPSKEIFSKIRNIHVPEMEFVEEQKNYTVWKSKYYQRLYARDKKNWELYMKLRRFYNNSRNETLNQFIHDKKRFIKRESSIVNENFYAAIEGKVPESIFDAVGIINSWAACFDAPIYYEFSVKNLAVENVNLILRDVIFPLRSNS